VTFPRITDWLLLTASLRITTSSWTLHEPNRTLAFSSDRRSSSPLFHSSRSTRSAIRQFSKISRARDSIFFSWRIYRSRTIPRKNERRSIMIHSIMQSLPSSVYYPTFIFTVSDPKRDQGRLWLLNVTVKERFRPHTSSGYCPLQWEKMLWEKKDPVWSG